MICDNCGKRARDKNNSGFCSNCGARLASVPYEDGQESDVIRHDKPIYTSVEAKKGLSVILKEVTNKTVQKSENDEFKDISFNPLAVLGGVVSIASFIVNPLIYILVLVLFWVFTVLSKTKIIKPKPKKSVEKVEKKEDSKEEGNEEGKQESKEKKAKKGFNIKSKIVLPKINFNLSMLYNTDKGEKIFIVIGGLFISFLFALTIVIFVGQY